MLIHFSEQNSRESQRSQCTNTKVPTLFSCSFFKIKTLISEMSFRYGHTAVFAEELKSMVVFGGYDSNAFLCNDLFSFDLGIYYVF